MLPARPPFGERTQPDGDAAIRQTDSDAALARWSAVQKHYLADPFLKPLLPRGAHLHAPRPPLINVGTYVRSEGVDKLVDGWLQLCAQEGKPCQIVSLGAGSDTRFWRIATGPHAQQLATYVEVDFPEVTTKKAMAIRKSRELSAHLGKSEDVKLAEGGTALHSARYHLVPVDMRRPPTEAMAPALSPILSSSLPTVLIFECVLAYMSPEASSALIQWFVDYFSTEGTVLGALVYEMFGLGDAFGKVMQDNLKARNVTLPGVEPYPDGPALPKRFLQHDFTTAHALTLREIRMSYISESERERMQQLEMLDELEELDLVLQHYAITWGVKLFRSDLSAPWTDWGFKQIS